MVRPHAARLSQKLWAAFAAPENRKASQEMQEIQEMQERAASARRTRPLYKAALATVLIVL